MICTRCAQGDHCNDPGCMCGHRPSRTLTDPVAPLHPKPVRPDLPVPSVPAADGVPPFTSPTPPFVTMLADWVREHRSGRFTEAATLRRKLTDYLDRMGER
jgi:hypothetical protein